jgi:hypothetical protein
MLFSIVCLTNVNTQPQTPVSFGGSTSVHFEYVNVTANPADPLMPLGCTIFDRHEFLTPADTLCVQTRCHNPTQPGASDGYLVVTAENPSLFNTPWSFNFLVGSEILVGKSGIVYGTNAIPFKSVRPFGQPTDVNGNGKLDFDNNEYTAAPDRLIVDCFIPDVQSFSGISLVSLTGNDQAVHDVLLSIWNDNEFPLSATFSFKCWIDQSYWWINPLFEVPFFWAIPNDPDEIDLDCDGIGDFESGWLIIDSLRVKNGAGQTIASDGALIGAHVPVFGGNLLWESIQTQTNGSFPP